MCSLFFLRWSILWVRSPKNVNNKIWTEVHMYIYSLRLYMVWIKSDALVAKPFQIIILTGIQTLENKHSTIYYVYSIHILYRAPKNQSIIFCHTIHGRKASCVCMFWHRIRNKYIYGIIFTQKHYSVHIMFLLRSNMILFPCEGIAASGGIRILLFTIRMAVALLLFFLPLYGPQGRLR